ncbi:uncharacterized protein isoform X2 [Choristoneura fumiferana]|uniref:uncharacterized protein isoform X2 n=1 Tax=Choristoneura fumiferana TaxID=7141 RepID=UPI003D15D1FE
MEEMIFTKILLSFLFLCRAVKADDLLMRKVSAKIELGAKICIEEHGFKKEVADQTKLFWDEDFKPTPEVGCLCGYREKVKRRNGRQLRVQGQGMRCSS